MGSYLAGFRVFWSPALPQLQAFSPWVGLSWESNSCPWVHALPARRASALLFWLRPTSARNRLASELTQCASASQSLRTCLKSQAAEITSRHSVRTQWASWVSGRSPVLRACLSVCLSVWSAACSLPAGPEHQVPSLPFRWRWVCVAALVSCKPAWDWPGSPGRRNTCSLP